MKPEMDMAEAIMKKVLDARPCRLDEEGEGRILLLVGQLLAWSGKMHIVGKTDVVGALTSQVVESLRMLDFAEDIRSAPRDEAGGGSKRSGGLGKIADIGSGFGFPALVWKGARNDLDITLIERKEKGAAFLGLLAARMGSAGIEVICGDAATAASPGIFSTVTSKAAGRLEDMLPIAGRLAERGGIYITLKGKGWEEEIPEARYGEMELLEARAVQGMAGELVAFSRKR